MPKGYKRPMLGIQSFRCPTTVEKFLLERGEFQSYLNTDKSQNSANGS